ncbi:STAS domain-containing protein [Amycolatopsis acidiphila]|uniref:STAS domain-containing protein n=1 Tax=Amycolatopsis acidiphila TaxID=715473 RepID=A0A558ADE7_9PSEU|nr:STAS domain-containing protein [Amycolatopsis acidiphila]TVT22294.1 STAS domain-containing protein [Amycolatopsis acidiphila]UIJ57991.1 STAS domain-containing protein [Amycolatopsis acidiphila]GHG70676.1 anti-sigma factor antagonist [Amycolatopsis acidiphila]
MSTPRPLNCTWAMTDPATGRITIDGDLDYDNADQLLYEVTERLSAGPGLKKLHLDCAALTFCDSYGLSTLLSVHRRLGEAGAVLHLENLPAGLTRLLRLTNTLAYFTGPAAVAQERSDPS